MIGRMLNRTQNLQTSTTQVLHPVIPGSPESLKTLLSLYMEQWRVLEHNHKQNGSVEK
jgi:hypothetical protein